MKLSTTTYSLMMALISVTTSCGVAIYDGQFVRAVAQSSTHATVQTVLDSHGDVGVAHSQHVHSEYNAMGSSLSRSFQYQSPSVTPRRHHKQLLKMLEQTGRHAFGDVHLPLLS